MIPARDAVDGDHSEDSGDAEEEGAAHAGAALELDALQRHVATFAPSGLVDLS